MTTFENAAQIGAAPARPWLRRLTRAIDEKLGRCARCMRLSAILTAMSWLLVALTARLTGPGVWQALAIAGASIFTALLLAHAVAFVVRPAPAVACATCAQRAAERAHRRRRQQRWAWATTLISTPAPTRRRRSGCRGCGATRRRPVDPEALPGAGEGLRGIVEASAEFHAISARLLSPEPEDSWRDETRHHFLYRLAPDATGDTAHALFVTRWDLDEPLSAVIVAPSSDGGEPHVTDLRTALSVR